MNQEKYEELINLVAQLHDLEEELGDEDHLDSDRIMAEVEGCKSCVEDGFENYDEIYLDRTIEEVQQLIEEVKDEL